MTSKQNKTPTLSIAEREHAKIYTLAKGRIRSLISILHFMKTKRYSFTWLNFIDS